MMTHSAKQSGNVRTVASLEAMFAAPFTAETSAVLFRRALTADFNALAVSLREALSLRDGCRATLGRERLDRLASGMDSVSAEAARIVLADMESLRPCETPPELRVIMSGSYSESQLVARFHPDGPNRYMCAYTEPVTEGLRPEDAVEAEPYMGKTVYDMKPDAEPIRFSLGDLWKQAGLRQAPKPFLHRAPAMAAGQPPRLLLLADIGQPGD